MTFSKFRYAIASLLLIGASSLLVSCASGTAKPLSAKTAGCTLNELEGYNEVPVTSKTTSKKTKTAYIEPSADCLINPNGA
ncbi:hypothetical protein QUF54_10740, partial [Candidatus Marithioploca araucensis]|nr:hypothetical protein [Candidatus Marithioploca araucensis]